MSCAVIPHTIIAVNMESAMETMRAELDDVHKAQEMLIETNQAHHMELAAFKETFENKMPKIAEQAELKQILLEAVDLVGNADTGNEYYIELIYGCKGQQQARYRLLNLYGTIKPCGTWEEHGSVMPFLVSGDIDSGMDNFPCDVGWIDIEDMKTRAVDRLVSGANGWFPVSLAIGPDYGHHSAQPIWHSSTRS